MSGTVCGRSVRWHGEDLNAVCQLPLGHQPSDQHCDGLWWFDNHGLRLPHLPTAESAYQGGRAGARGLAQHP